MERIVMFCEDAIAEEYFYGVDSLKEYLEDHAVNKPFTVISSGVDYSYYMISFSNKDEFLKVYNTFIAIENAYYSGYTDCIIRLTDKARWVVDGPYATEEMFEIIGLFQHFRKTKDFPTIEDFILEER